MLDDRERRRLHELERQFVAEDPEFRESFDARAKRLDRTSLRTSATVAITIAVAACSVMLAVGSPAGALAFVIGTWLVWGAWWGSRRRDGGWSGRPR